MTVQERLEEIKRLWHEEDTLDFDEYDWLIQQAERVQKLEKDIENYKKACASWEAVESYSRKESQRYKQELKDIRTFALNYDAEEQAIQPSEIIGMVNDALKGDSNG